MIIVIENKSTLQHGINVHEIVSVLSSVGLFEDNANTSTV